jgi:hypothetical protein
MQSTSREAVEARARRAAKRLGLIARKSRAGLIDNFGDFMLIDPSGNRVVAGSRFNLTAEDVIAYCAKASKNLEAKRQQRRSLNKFLAVWDELDKLRRRAEVIASPGKRRSPTA